MKKLLFVLIALACFGVVPSTLYSLENSEDTAQTCKTGETFEGNLLQDKEDVADDIYWDFITCTSSQSECSWEASYHGFHHWKAVHDHHTCGGSSHYACYGGHH